MATAGFSFVSSEIKRLDVLSYEIKHHFNELQRLLEKQMNELLKIVREMKEMYQRQSELNKNISQMETVIKQMNITLTENRIAEKNDQGLGWWENKISEMRDEITKLGSVCELKLVYNIEAFVECVDTIQLTTSEKLFETDGIETNRLDGSVIFAKIDLDHQYGMAWPSIAYKKFREKSGSLFRETLREIDTSRKSSVRDFDSKMSKYLRETKSENIFIIIFGFSAFGRGASTLGNFIFPSHSDKVSNEFYGLKRLFALIDSNEFAHKRKFIVLVTLPSKDMRFRDDYYIDEEETHKYYLPLNSVVLECSDTNNIIINMNRDELHMFYRKLMEGSEEYFQNKLSKVTFMNNLNRVGFHAKIGKGIFCFLSFLFSEWRYSDEEIKEQIVKGRDWIYKDDTKFELGYNKEEYPSLIEDFVKSLKRYIKEHKIECIIVLITQSEDWNSKDESLEVYSNILRALSKEIKDSYDLPTVCIIEDDLFWMEIRNGLPFREEFKFTEEDTGAFKEIVDTNSNMYFVLPYSNYGIDFLIELSEPHTRSLGDLNEMCIRNKEKMTRKRQFSKVICQSDKMDFIFPAPKLP